MNNEAKHDGDDIELAKHGIMQLLNVRRMRNLGEDNPEMLHLRGHEIKEMLNHKKILGNLLMGNLDVADPTIIGNPYYSKPEVTDAALRELLVPSKESSNRIADTSNLVMVKAERRMLSDTKAYEPDDKPFVITDVGLEELKTLEKPHRHVAHYFTTKERPVTPAKSVVEIDDGQDRSLSNVLQAITKPGGTKPGGGGTKGGSSRGVA